MFLSELTRAGPGGIGVRARRSRSRILAICLVGAFAAVLSLGSWTGSSGKKQESRQSLAWVEGDMPGLGEYLIETGYIYPAGGVGALLVALILRPCLCGGGRKKSTVEESLKPVPVAKSSDVECPPKLAAEMILESGFAAEYEKPAATTILASAPVPPPPPSGPPCPTILPPRQSTILISPSHAAPLPPSGTVTPTPVPTVMDHQQSSVSASMGGYSQMPLPTYPSNRYAAHYAMTPARQLSAQGSVPQHYAEYHPPQPSHLAVQDFKSLLDRAKHDEMLAQGVAGVRAAFCQQVPDLATRMGAMTAKKVIEIERLLIEEMEASLTSKMGFVASLFHTWRSEVILQKAGHKAHVEAELKRADWERYLNDEVRSYEDRLAEAAKVAMATKERWAQSVKVVTDQWVQGQDFGLVHTVFKTWQDWAHTTAAKQKRKKNVFNALSCWAEGQSVGSVHAAFRSWAQQVEHQKEVKRHSTDYDEAEQTWREELEKRNAANEAALDDAMQKLFANKTSGIRAVDVIINTWERGDRQGLLLSVLSLWRKYSKERGALKRRKVSVQQALRQFCEGSERGSTLGCFVLWRNYAVFSRAFAHEQQKWEKFVTGEDARKRQDDEDLRIAEANKREALHKTTEMMLNKWLQGDSEGIVYEVFDSWKSFVRKGGMSLRKREQVHTSLVQWAAGEADAGLLHVCMLKWKHWARTQRIYKGEIYGRDRKLEEMEDRVRQLLVKEQTRLIKYATMIGTASDPSYLMIVFSSWRMHCHGLKSLELQRKMEVQLQEKKRLQDIATLKRTHLLTSSLEMMGLRNRKTILLDSFVGWLQAYREAKQAWTHALTHSKMVTKYAWFLECQFLKQDASAYLAACFNEILREAKHNKHVRDKEALEINERIIMQFEEERSSLEYRLQVSDDQIHRITETLKKELTNKQELADELEQAYEQLRARSNTVHADLTQLQLRTTRALPSARGSGSSTPGRYS
eukprot:TRINITY_DN20194_c0_g1_i1.p1 TRINITY_DN20194_c0_g1~~TRINITY_DN20194_c0_g1_i1.p1  ORF type:complete len:973 (-),score=254.82 TRINITY_DN20194_c0_g1_i1:141-3059(-)